MMNLCNTAPLLKRNQLVVRHDAAVFAVPEAYTPAFRWWYRLVFRVVSRVCRRMLTVSEFSRGELARYLRCLEASIGVVPEGGEHILRFPADHSVFERYGLGARPYVLAVSSLNPHKNFRAVARAIELLGDLDCEFVVAGGTNPRIFAGDDGYLSGRIKHIGYVRDEELRALYHRALCLVYPSLYEGLGLPPLEAMICGCPVVASTAASVPEVCGDAALYCDPHDPSKIAAQVRWIVSDTGLRRDL